ncbi:ATP-binding protein [Actinocrispum wychmicini]|uniref:Putative ATPase n=1 Tax=Actinocrispum wychmicini TaxID=1213861 RepID=A0A4R2JJ67_9PSEU|nr:NB-ARC domain-containing protein [Actinocrispum wychmicini]TCO54195.1 putative ATPase [Actinocrispum wychmicini]
MKAQEPGTPVPDPLNSKGVVEFVGLLNRLRLWAGQPSLRRLRALGGQIRAPSGSLVDVLPSSTTSAVLNGEGLPRMEFVEAFVGACLKAGGRPVSEIHDEVERWREAWRRIAIVARHAEPVTVPLRSPDGPCGVGRNDLPSDVVDFTGRVEELQWLSSVLSNNDNHGAAAVVLTIDGMAGVGKTALAVHLAHQLAARYPDGQLFIDLHAHTAGREPLRPAAALATLLRAWGVGADRIPDEVDPQAALWRSLLARRRMLIVLDDAADANQVRHLLPGTAGCLTVVTSRRRLVGLDAAYTLSLDVLPRNDAVALFGRALGDDRARRDPVAVADVVRMCGHLPLAVRLTTSRLRTRPVWTVADLADRMRNGRRLSEMAAEDRGVAAAFTVSYQHLSPDLRRVFRLVGMLPGEEFGADVVAALAGCGRDEAERSLEELLDVHLLRQPTAGRYRLHELLRHHAYLLAHETETADERRAAVARVFQYYLKSAKNTADSTGPDTIASSDEATTRLCALGKHMRGIVQVDGIGDRYRQAPENLIRTTDGSLRCDQRIAPVCPFSS